MDILNFLLMQEIIYRLEDFRNEIASWKLPSTNFPAKY